MGDGGMMMAIDILMGVYIYICIYDGYMMDGYWYIYVCIALGNLT